LINSISKTFLNSFIFKAYDVDLQVHGLNYLKDPLVHYKMLPLKVVDNMLCTNITQAKGMKELYYYFFVI